MEFLCQSASDPTSHIENQDVQSQLDVEDALSNVFESNAAGVRHCALTNADEVQQNVVTAKKGKKRGIKAILRRSR